MDKTHKVILRRLEKILQTDVKYLITGGFWLSIGQITTFVSLMILSLAFANLISPDIYGTYKYILSLFALFGIFTLPGFATAITRSVSRGDEQTIHSALKLRMRWSLIGTLLAISGSGYYLVMGNTTLSLALIIIGLVLPFFDTLNLYNPYLTGKKNFKTQTLLHIISQIISITSLLCALALTNNVLFIISAYFFPLLLVRLVFFRLIIPKNQNLAPDTETLRYGKHLSLIHILGVIASHIDTLLLWQFLGPQKVAIYTFALAIPEQIKGPLKSVSELAFPKFANLKEHQTKHAVRALWRKLFLYGCLLLTISILYYFAAPYIFKLFFPGYIGSVLYSQVFMFASLGLIGTIPASMLGAQKKLREQYLFSTIQPILQIIFFLILIPLYGIWGAIIARVLMRGVFVVFASYLTYRAFR